MYKVKKVIINNFWYRLNAACEFNEDVNIIIGRNGTGKTTFMNILHAALSVDLDELTESDFDSIEIKLTDGSKEKTIKVRKVNDVNTPFQPIEYQISKKKYSLRGFPQDERRFPSSYRRRALEESLEVRNQLNALVALSSLSVYRLRSGDDFEVKDRLGRRVISPVDYRLSQLYIGLTKYQFDLSQRARDISMTLQKDVLASILYSNTKQELKIPSSFDKKKERRSLVSAYSRLGAIDEDVKKKISFHIGAIETAVTKLKENNLDGVEFGAFEAFIRTQKIIDLSLQAEEKTNSIYSQINLFIETLQDFIPDKKFVFESSALHISSLDGNDIPVEKLSSGEKQLLILLIETLLQKCSPYTYLTDEPELSLHIEWQRKIIPAVKKLNPHAQIIAATHSPELASEYKKALINMKNVISN